MKHQRHRRRLWRLDFPFPPDCVFCAKPPTDRPGDLYCICGGSLVLLTPVEPQATTFRQAWRAAHTGEGHAPCSARTAWKVRKRLTDD